MAYEVNGELIVRISKETDAARRFKSTRREAGLLAAVARFSTLPVPEPVFPNTDAGVFAYRKLPGVPLKQDPMEEPTRLAPALGEFVSCLHRAPLDELQPLVERDTCLLSAWRDDAERNYREVAGHLPAAARPLVEDFLGRRLPADFWRVAFCHKDLGAEHILVDVGTSLPTGVLDWADAAIAEPALDFARLYRDFGPGFCDLMVAHYDGTWVAGDRERTDFYARCALLEDLVFGMETDAHVYVKNALANIDRMFASATAPTPPSRRVV